MEPVTISEKEFGLFRDWLYQHVGILLTKNKMPLVSGRLAKRLRHHGVPSYGDYFRFITGPDGEANGELQVAIDLLTTNETQFFREPRHFDFLRERVLPEHPPGRRFRVWSAASSSGEEAYTLAMTLADELGDAPWEVFGSDISSRVLAAARRGLYPMQRAQQIPLACLRRYCLKGVGRHQGAFLIDPALRKRVSFQQVNLNASLPKLGEFDVIFLRNVMIYFNQETKREVVHRLMEYLRSGGYLIIGHSESLNGITDRLQTVVPSVYRKP